MKTIEVVIGDNASIEKAQKELDEYFKGLKEKAKRLEDELAAYGGYIASIGFSQAPLHENEYSDVQVKVTGSNKGIRIEAIGYAVFFIEFGTGTKYGYGHPMADQFGFGPTTWSLGPQGKGHLKNQQYWYTPDGRRTTGDPPAMAMYKARNEMLTKVTELARKVFK